MEPVQNLSAPARPHQWRSVTPPPPTHRCTNNRVFACILIPGRTELAGWPLPIGLPNRDGHSANGGRVSGCPCETRLVPTRQPSGPRRLSGRRSDPVGRRQPFRSPLYPAIMSGSPGTIAPDPDCVGAEPAKPLFGSSTKASDRSGPLSTGLGEVVVDADDCGLARSNSLGSRANASGLGLDASGAQ